VTDILARDATDQLAALGRREISARDLLQASVARADATAKALNTVVAKDLDRAFAEALRIDDRRARALLDALLASMPLDLRTVFVLYELEELTMAEIARALDLPAGTVASRLRRAREAFEELSRRVRRDLGRKGGLR